MLHRLSAVGAWGLLAFITYATFAPVTDRPRLATSTSFEHVAAFALLGLLFCLAYPERIRRVCTIVFASAAGLELAQQLTLDRHGRLWDAGEKLAGGAGGILIGTLVLWLSSEFIDGQRSKSE